MYGINESVNIGPDLLFLVSSSNQQTELASAGNRSSLSTQQLPEVVEKISLWEIGVNASPRPHYIGKHRHIWTKLPLNIPLESIGFVCVMLYHHLDPLLILCLFLILSLSCTSYWLQRLDWSFLWAFLLLCIANKWESAWRHDPCSEQLTHNRTPIPLLRGRGDNITSSHWVLTDSDELLTPEICPHVWEHILHRDRKCQKTRWYRKSTSVFVKATPYQTPKHIKALMYMHAQNDICTNKLS